MKYLMSIGSVVEGEYESVFECFLNIPISKINTGISSLLKMIGVYNVNDFIICDMKKIKEAHPFISNKNTCDFINRQRTVSFFVEGNELNCKMSDFNSLLGGFEYKDESVSDDYISDCIKRSRIVTKESLEQLVAQEEIRKNLAIIEEKLESAKKKVDLWNKRKKIDGFIYLGPRAYLSQDGIPVIPEKNATIKNKNAYVKKTRVTAFNESDNGGVDIYCDWAGCITSDMSYDEFVKEMSEGSDR